MKDEIIGNLDNYKYKQAIACMNSKGRLKAQNDGSYEAYAKLDETERQKILINYSETYRKADAEAQNWGVGGKHSRALNAGITLATGLLGGQSGLQSAVNAAAPYASEAIGRTFGHGENKNETAQAVGHFLLGAAIARINGGNFTAGGSAAVAAEKAAEHLAQRYNDGKTAIDPQTGEFNANLLPEHIKEEIKSKSGVIASLTGAAVGGTPVDAQTGGAVGQNAVENNLYLTSEALKKDKQTARKIYSVIKEQVKHECSSTGRITECRQNIGRIIEFTQDKRFDSRFKDLKKESLYYLNKHPDLVASYLKAEYEKLDREDKSILHRYISPGAEIVSGSLGVVLSGVAGGGSCAETFGLGCAAALVGVTSSYDHVITGTKNFGKKASEQRPTIAVQALKQLGLSEQAAEYVQFSIDLFSVGKSGGGIPKAKPVFDAKPRWEVDRKLNKLTTREQVEKNVQETRRRSQSSQFKAHAQREWENKTGLDFNHFIGGDINKKGTVTGGHSLTRGDVRVIQQTSAPDKHGVYQATVEIKKPDGSWEVKTKKGGKVMTKHTMFPKDWDEARIRAEVTSAWESRIMLKDNKWQGTSKSGIKIEGFTEPNRTAYPIYE
ncbi:EndoU domain-containing protein [Neisseria meningitidis]|nr:EndoU domain-containing protein [Neisseria meningitidis]